MTLVFFDQTTLTAAIRCQLGSSPTSRAPLNAGLGFGLGRRRATTTGSGGISRCPSSPLAGGSPSSLPSSLGVDLDFFREEEPRPWRPPRPRRNPPDVLSRVLPFPLVADFFLLFVGAASSSLADSDREWDVGAGVGDAESLFRLLRKSLMTSCSRLLAYAFRLRGAYVPVPAVTSKKEFRSLCLFSAAAYPATL
jgi:hypothetical protein